MTRKNFEEQIRNTRTSNGLDFLMTGIRLAWEERKISKKSYLKLMAMALEKKISIAE